MLRQIVHVQLSCLKNSERDVQYSQKGLKPDDQEFSPTGQGKETGERDRKMLPLEYKKLMEIKIIMCNKTSVESLVLVSNRCELFF